MSSGLFQQPVCATKPRRANTRRIDGPKEPVRWCAIIPKVYRMPNSKRPSTESKSIVTSETFRFFRDLSRNNRTEWMDSNRDRYKQCVVQPLRALCEELAPAVLTLDPPAEKATGPTLRKLLVRHGKRRMEATRRLARRGKLEKAASLDCAARVQYQSCDAQGILRRTRENFPRHASITLLHFSAELNKAKFTQICSNHRTHTRTLRKRRAE